MYIPKPTYPGANEGTTSPSISDHTEQIQRLQTIQKLRLRSFSTFSSQQFLYARLAYNPLKNICYLLSIFNTHACPLFTECLNIGKESSRNMAASHKASMRISIKSLLHVLIDHTFQFVKRREEEPCDRITEQLVRSIPGVKRGSKVVQWFDQISGNSIMKH